MCKTTVFISHINTVVQKHLTTLNHRIYIMKKYIAIIHVNKLDADREKTIRAKQNNIILSIGYKQKKLNQMRKKW